jgi:hypothetical protein
MTRPHDLLSMMAIPRAVELESQAACGRLDFQESRLRIDAPLPLEPFAAGGFTFAKPKGFTFASGFDEHDVLRLQITVDHAGVMGRLEGPGDLPTQAGDPLPVQRALRADGAKVDSVEVLHHEVRYPRRTDIEVQHLDDVRMLQQGCHFRLRAESDQALIVPLLLDATAQRSSGPEPEIPGLRHVA